MVLLLRTTILLFFSFGLVLVASAELLKIDGIEISGNERTGTDVILRELGINQGDSISEEALNSRVQRLRNIRIFSQVESKLSRLADDRVKVKIWVHERWTTIPIFKIASGGGVSQTTVGVYDSNLGGRYLEAGAQASKLEDVYSGVVWFKNPRLFDKRLVWDLQLWNTSRVRTKYNQDLDEAVPITGFLHRRDRAYTALTWLMNDSWSLRAGTEFNRDSFSDKFLDPEIKQLLAAKPLPPDADVWLSTIGLQWGQIDYNGHLEDGLLVDLEYGYGAARSDGIKDFHQTNIAFEYKKSFLGRGTFAQRNLSGTTTTQVLQYWYYLGGLDRIRGFSNDRFAGRYYLLNNSEFRWVWWDRPKYIVQSVAFIDALSAGEEFRTLGTLKGASAGVGLRVVLPRVYRFVLRFDYASPLRKEDDMNVSFGVQQFF
ncbi:MAG: BamA/TamA family outer membrane protein [Bdellovibrionaceae bacterium]|nr:BamA/TamA family outer membrane protein [Bdellovibrionales bacterium]MCB9084351.1 BamA/TamA family outer membrane protein [Pseudobdellovibrionaceae bacterium]